MPLPINIIDLIYGNTVEWERLEFKLGWNPNDTMHTITAFANDINNWGGGYIIIGIDEKNGRPVLPPKGLDENSIDRIQKELLNHCYQIKPNYFPIMEPVEIKGRQILVVWAPGGQNRPYNCPKDFHAKKKEKAYYIRRYSNTVKAGENERKELYLLAGNIPFDDRINHFAEISDIKLDLVKEFLNDVKSELYYSASNISMETLGKQMNILDGSSEQIKPKNIGLLMFSDNPQHFFPMSQIELIQFEESEAGDVFTEKIFKGPIHNQVRKVLSYIESTIIKEKIIKIKNKAEAIRVFNYPYAALEEAIVNAIYHRSYEEREPIEIRVYPKKIIVLSYPGPDKSIKKADIESGNVIARRYRNRRIGEFLKELRLTEGRSTGIPKILRAMKYNNSPAPVFDTDEERTYFIVEFQINSEFLPSNKAQDKAQDKAQ
ncbi:MAG: RNA-binding domain-containing protein, partial [Alkaliphilus sp.]